MSRLVALVIALAVAGCSANEPQLGARISARISTPISTRATNGRPPSLQPIDKILAGAGGATLTSLSARALEGRASRLRRTARRLRNPVLDRASRERLLAAIARHARRGA